jgi:CheY-like chemotaxis protein
MPPARILIVEDNPLIAMELLNSIAERFGEGSQFVLARSLQQARREAEAKFSLALLDLGVGGGAAIDLAASIAGAGTPIVVVASAPPLSLPKILRGAPLLLTPLAAAEIRRVVESLAQARALKDLM